MRPKNRTDSFEVLAVKEAVRGGKWAGFHSQKQQQFPTRLTFAVLAFCLRHLAPLPVFLARPRRKSPAQISVRFECKSNLIYFTQTTTGYPRNSPTSTASRGLSCICDRRLVRGHAVTRH